MDMTRPRPVQLRAPAERSSVRLARLVASGVGAEAGFSIDDTEDLRIAVSELVALLVDGLDGAGDSIVVSYWRAPGEVTVEGECDAAARGPNGSSTVSPDPAAISAAARAAAADAKAAGDDLALEILRVVVDDHSFEADDDGRRFRLVKRSRAAT